MSARIGFLGAKVSSIIVSPLTRIFPIPANFSPDLDKRLNSTNGGALAHENVFVGVFTSLLSVSLIVRWRFLSTEQERIVVYKGGIGCEEVGLTIAIVSLFRFTLLTC